MYEIQSLADFLLAAEVNTLVNKSTALFIYLLSIDLWVYFDCLNRCGCQLVYPMYKIF